MRKTVFLFVVLVLSLCLCAQERKEMGREKVATPLLQARYAPDDSIIVSVSVKTGFAPATGRMLYKPVSPLSVFILKLRRSEIEALAANDHTLFISEVIAPREELNSGTFDITLNGIAYAHSAFPQFKGNSLHAIIKERLFDTTDIDLRNRVERSGLENSAITPHASIMATIVAGNGNSSPTALGTATQARLSSVSFSNLLPEPDATIQQLQATVENHSYGTAVENFYGNEAAAYDAQTNRLTRFLPVFSSGNSGDVTPATGIYTGIPQLANLTGNFKQAKNIIIVGATDSTGVIALPSSKGPAYDGRIKPELVAYGEDGSSGAAALTSGAALLVQDAYRQAQSALPSSALVKAVLLNSADDAGTPHPDYASGYGSLNAYRALTTVRDHHYMEGTSLPSTVTSFSITVPAGLSQLKLTLAWNDPAASPNATKALVNDLDLQLNFPSTGESWKPWVLDPRPNAATLLAPAQRKTDTLNNVEQVTLDAPAAGVYRIDISGTRLATATQDFALAYQFDTASRFYWTYPTTQTNLFSGLGQVLRWQTTMTGTAQVEYATSGANWRSIGTVSDVSKKYIRWSVPDTVTTAVVRLRMQDGTLYLSDTFTISSRLRPDVGFNCTDSFLLYWNKLPVNQYRVYQLAGNELAAFAQTPDTAILLAKAQHPAVFYAIAPIIGNREGIRSNSLNYPAQPTGCYITTFFFEYQTNKAAFFTAELGTLMGITGVDLQKKRGNGFVTITALPRPSSTTFPLSDSTLTQGENYYRIAVHLSNGATVYSDVVTVYFLPSSPVVFYPNPVGQQEGLHIITNESGRFTMQLLDVNGRVLKQELLNANYETIRVDGLSKGLYFIRLLDGGHQSFVQKLIVK